MIKVFKIDNKTADQRVDKFLKRQFVNLTQSFIEKNLRKKNILLNNYPFKSNYIVKIDDIITIKNFSDEVYQKFKKNKSEIQISTNYKNKFNRSITYENENFLVIDKWSGIASQGGTSILMSIDKIIKSISIDYNLVHRLDKETSGLMIIAKNLKYTKLFGQLFKSQKLMKTYLAICNGRPKLRESYVDLNIDSTNKSKPIATKTFYRVLSYNQKACLIKFVPKTGKKHQLRIVAKNLGSPIVGDLKYNLNNNNKNENLKLNAFKLQFNIGDDEFNIQSELPKDFTDYLFSKNIKVDLKVI